VLIVPVVVLALQPRQPGLDLAATEPDPASDPEAVRAAALAAVVERLGADAELLGELGDGEHALEGVVGVGCGVHDR